MNSKKKTNCKITQVDQQSADTTLMSATKQYETPVLIAYGDVRDITLGGTLGFGESGAGFADFEVIRP